MRGLTVYCNSFSSGKETVTVTVKFLRYLIGIFYLKKALKIEAKNKKKEEIKNLWNELNQTAELKSTIGKECQHLRTQVNREVFQFLNKFPLKK